MAINSRGKLRLMVGFRLGKNGEKGFLEEDLSQGLVQGWGTTIGSYGSYLQNPTTINPHTHNQQVGSDHSNMGVQQTQASLLFLKLGRVVVRVQHCKVTNDWSFGVGRFMCSNDKADRPSISVNSFSSKA